MTNKTTILEGACFVTIGALTPIVDKLAGDSPLTTRAIVLMVVVMLVGAANALKAFLSQSTQRPPPVNPPAENTMKTASSNSGIGALVAIFALACVTIGHETKAGQTPPPAPPVVDVGTLTNFAAEIERAGNFTLAVVPGYMAALDHGAWGVGVFAGYQATPYVGAFLRADLFDGNGYVGSGSATFQYPIKLSPTWTLRPLAEVGAGTAFSGAGAKNRDVFAIAGGGAALDFWTSKDGRNRFSAVCVVETWQPVFDKPIYRGGLAWTHEL